MEPLTRKKISRTALRNHCKKLEVEIETLTKEFDEMNLTRLRSLRSNYEAQIAKIAKASDEVQNLLTEEQEIMDDMENSMVESDLHFDVLAKIDTCLESAATKDVKVPHSTPTKPTGSASSVRVKVPKIDMPTFDGDILKWQTFWDQFESCVHNQSDMSEIDKFTYLQRALSSTARNCISGLMLTKENYASAVDMLKQRFGNEQALLNAYIDSFVQLPKVKSMNRVAELRQVYDKLEGTVRNLRSLNVQASTYGCFLVPILTDKLPDELTIIMARKFKTGAWPIAQVLQIFKEELEAKEMCTKSTPSKRESPSDNDPFSTSNLFGQAKQEQQRSRGGKRQNNKGKGISCPYCKSNHPPSQCQTVTDVKARTNLLRKAGRCFICLQPGHISSNCLSEYKCVKCEERHHISICSRNPAPAPAEENPPPPPPAAAVPTNNSLGSSVIAPSADVSTPVESVMSEELSTVTRGVPEVVTSTAATESAPMVATTEAFVPSGVSNSSLSSENDKEVLLATARAQVFREDETRREYTRMLFDNGSQRTYVTEELVTKLDATVVEKKKLSIGTLGSAVPREEDVKVVKIKVRNVMKCVTNDEYVEIEACVIPTICLPLSNQCPKVVKSRYKHLQGLYLSDFVDSSRMKVDILIGGDFYYSFVSGRCIRGDGLRDPVALETSVGWVLNGPYSKSYTLHSTELLATTHSLMCTSRESRLEKTLTKFWEIESVGESEESSVYEKFADEIEFNGERYVTKLPFRPHHDQISDNFRLSYASLCWKFDKDPELREKYKDVFRDYADSEIIEKVPDTDSGTPGRVHYIPHHAVIRPDRETTKIRPVFDCSAKTGGPSLNECLYTGPNLLGNIFDILLRFRTNKIAIISDIKKAFLNSRGSRRFSPVLDVRPA